jgi:hypothetical protein
MPKIFISYRREDSEHVAGRIYDRLYTHFGRDNVSGRTGTDRGGCNEKTAASSRPRVSLAPGRLVTGGVERNQSASSCRGEAIVALECGVHSMAQLLLRVPGK